MGVSLLDVTKRFGQTVAVDGVSLEVETGELVAVLGPSGCGKTTLLRLIAGFECPDEGAIELSGRTVTCGPTWVSPERRRIGMVFQDYALFPHLTVQANVAFGLDRAERRGPRFRRGDRPSPGAAATRALELVGLQHKADRLPHELSGGERQRVALARALAPEPEVVLLDEPFSSLDASLRSELRREVELILREAGATALLVTHDQEEALVLADRLAVMNQGRVVQTGPPEVVYTRPATRFCAQFLGEVNVLSGMAGGRGVRTELGAFDAAARGGGAVQLAVRPEQLVLRDDEHGNAQVIDREFRGHDVMYRVRHEAGRTLLVQLPSLQLHDVGARVHVGPAPSAVGSVLD